MRPSMIPSIALFLALVGSSGAFLAPVPASNAVVVRSHDTALGIFGGKKASIEPPPVIQEEEDESPSWAFNPFYGALSATIFTYAAVFSPGEFNDPRDFQIVQAIIEQDPSISPLFSTVFNLLGVMPLVMACLIFPQAAAGKGFPATPFVASSIFAGFFGLAPYLTFRAPPVSSKSRDELAWVARNVLESKWFGLTLVGLTLAVPISMGVLSAPDGMIDGYLELASTTKIASVSSFDFAVLTVAAASLIPGDYRLRVSSDDDTAKNINILAASTVLLPILGAAIYCAWRPALPDGENL